MKTSYYMKRICSNCDKDMGITPCNDVNMHLEITHGICLDCMLKLYSDDFSPEELEALKVKHYQGEICHG